VEVYFTFTLTGPSSNLWIALDIDDYQFLHETVSNLHQAGLTFKEIADGLIGQDIVR